MLMKELCSYPWVRETYGAQLPDASLAGSAAHAADRPQRAAGTAA